MNTVPTKREMVREKLGNALALFVLIVIGLLALVGPNGFLAWRENAAQLQAHQARIAVLEEERAVLANRVELLDPNNVDPDLGSELVRETLGVAHKDEVIVEPS